VQRSAFCSKHDRIVRLLFKTNSKPRKGCNPRYCSDTQHHYLLRTCLVDRPQELFPKEPKFHFATRDIGGHFLLQQGGSETSALRRIAQVNQQKSDFVGQRRIAFPSSTFVARNLRRD
jgi:hypothetical protein